MIQLRTLVSLYKKCVKNSVDFGLNGLCTKLWTYFDDTTDCVVFYGTLLSGLFYDTVLVLSCSICGKYKQFVNHSSYWITQQEHEEKEDSINKSSFHKIVPIMKL